MSHWPRISGYVACGGLTNAEVQQPHLTSLQAAGAGGGECRQWGETGRCRTGDTYVFTHVSLARKTGGGSKRMAATGGRLVNSAIAACSFVCEKTLAQRAKGKSKAPSEDGGASNGSRGGGSDGSGSGSGSGSSSGSGSGSGRGSDSGSGRGSGSGSSSGNGPGSGGSGDSGTGSGASSGGVFTRSVTAEADE